MSEGETEKKRKIGRQIGQVMVALFFFLLLYEANLIIWLLCVVSSGGVHSENVDARVSAEDHKSTVKKTSNDRILLVGCNFRSADNTNPLPCFVSYSSDAEPFGRFYRIQ